MRVLIADDEAPARAKLRRLLATAPDVEIVAEVPNGAQAVAAIERTNPDVVLLDIQMPGLDGFGVVDAISGADAPYVVFVTADDRSAIRAFEVGAVEYLLKPFTPSRFAQVLERARERVESRPAAHAAVPETPAPHEPLRRLLVVHGGRAAFLAVEQVDRIEADRNYVHVVSGGARYRLRATIATLAARLDPAQFLRINRSTLVRIDAIKEMHEWSHGDFRVVMRDGTALTWSRRYRAAVERVFGVHG